MLRDKLKKLASKEGLSTIGIEGVEVFRLSSPFSKINTVLPASVCILVEGSKNLYLGKEKYVYNENSFLIGTAKMPVVSELLHSSDSKPCLGVMLYLDASMIAELVQNFDELNMWQVQKKAEQIITTSPVNATLTNALERLLDTAHRPLDIKVLSQSFIREIFFEILKSSEGHILRNSVQSHTKAHEMVPVIQYLEKSFKSELSIEEIAKHASMSIPSLHKNFKKATSLSPMQFIKQLRLHNAHALLLSGHNASSAATASGYASASQFSREFKRLFGYSPRSIKISLT